MANLLIVDDDHAYSGLLKRAFVACGHSVATADSLARTREALAAGGADLVLLDVNLPDGNGLYFMEELLSLPDPPDVLVITGAPEDEGARFAVDMGAWDYICKSDSLDRSLLAANQALRFREDKKLARLKNTIKNTGIIGDCPAVGKVLDLAARAAAVESPVLITGETGTGKELFARAIHRNGPRAEGEFVTVDCAATPPQLIESILFGHRRGAFTGADADHRGLVALAHRGTLFLDEIGELPLEAQKRFLRVVQEKTYRPVGSLREEESDFRLICATNRDLEAAVKDGLFRLDLFYRIRSTHIELPPLRDRREDIPKIVRAHLAQTADPQSGGKELSEEVFGFLEEYDWPGNVRELLQVIDATRVNAVGFPTIYPIHLPPFVRARRGFGKALPVDPAAQAEPETMALSDFREKVLQPAERSYFAQVIRASGGDYRRACALTGLSRSRLYALLQKHSLNLK